MSKISLSGVSKIYQEFHYFLRILDSFKTDFRQLLVMCLAASETKTSHFLVLGTFKTGIRHNLVDFKTSFRLGLGTV